MKTFFYSFLCCIFLTACSNNMEPVAVQESVTSGIQGISGVPVGPPGPPLVNPNGAIVLGKKLENPYTVAAMKTAFYNVVKATQVGPPGPQGPMGPGGVYQSDIEPTHYYIRFLPKNDDEYHALDGLTLYPYPLDYEIKEGGVYYSDGPEDNYAWQYTTIKVGTSIPNVEYEILAELFLLDDGDFIPTKSGKQFSRDLWDKMETESLRLTGNEDYSGSAGPAGPAGPPARAKWRPSGNIKVTDNKVGYIPLQGVTVRARRWFTTYIGITDAQGNYSVNGEFKRPANYSIIWTDINNNWVIRKGWFGAAFYNGPKKHGTWDLSIDRFAGATLGLATIHRAAYRMYYKDILGLKRPYYYRSMKICYINQSGGGDFWGNVGLGIFPDIRIYSKNSEGDIKNPRDIFLTTIHELAHAAHLVNTSHIQYWQYKNYIYESWAIAVEKVITEVEYLELCENDYAKAMKLLYGEPEYLGGSGPGPRPYAVGNLPFYVPDNFYNYQQWPFKDHGKTIESKKNIKYTPMFIDLIDDDNQRMYYFYKAEEYSKTKEYLTPAEIDAFCEQFPYDEIAHFTLKEVQDIVYNQSYGFSDLKRNIKRSATGRMLGNDAIDYFFERYEYYINKYGK